MHVTDLRCEHLVQPVTDNTRPALSWAVESDTRGDVQTAYRILVASSPEALARDEGDLWDTGKVPSAETLCVPYAGKPLVSRESCWWKVCVWDADDRPSPWSETARWEMGLLRPEDWRARWIRAVEPSPAEETESVDTFEGLQWLWYPGEANRESAPAETRVFRKTFRVPEGKTVRSAFFRLAADDRFDLFVNGHLAGRGDNFKRPVTADVGAYLANGENTLAIVATNAQGPAGVIGFLRVQLDPGDRLTVPVDTTWKAGKGTDPEADDTDWPGAEVIGAYGDEPWGRSETVASLVLPPAPLFRTEFSVAKPVRSARLYVTALGACDAVLNGKSVTQERLRPGWTDFRKRVQYQAYDVTDLLRPGANCLGATVGSGWAAGYVGFGGRDRYGVGRQRFLAQLEVAFEDGTSEVVATDSAWRSSYGGTLEADLLMGETFDARKEPDGWSLPGFDDSSWSRVEEAAWDAPLEAYPGVPVRRLMELKPLSRTEPKAGTFIFDLGQNMVGWARLKVSGPAGTSVRLRFAEMLNPDGTAYTTNLRAARATDTYTLNGNGEEVWEPLFTFHGFRYVEVTGYPGTPPLDAVTGIVAGSDTPFVGGFSCSNPLLNQLQHNIQWGQRGNFLEVPTDCPQRDERLGWMGDAQVFVRAACVNADTAAFFVKWLRDVRDAQTKDGAFTDVSPDLLGGHGVAGWAEAGIIVPVTLYQFTGDLRFLEDNFEAMSRYIAWMEAHSNDLIRPAEGYGDWLSIGAETPKDVISTAFFAWVAAQMADVADILGKPDDARRFADLAGRVRAAFNKAFVAPDGRIAGDTQTGYVLALHMDLLPEDLRPKALRYLVDDIARREYHLSTGFLGTAYVMQVLTRFGRTDVAYRLLLQDTMPSWLFSVKNGATTIWERWDGWTPEKGFQDPGMNSFNHYAFGAVGAWMTGVITGVEPAEPGFRRIIICPQPGGGLTHAEATYRSPRGPIRSAWRIDKGSMTLEVTVPANTTALVSLPTSKASEVTESGTPASAAEGVVFEGIREGRAEYRVGGGRYSFRFPWGGSPAGKTVTLDSGKLRLALSTRSGRLRLEEMRGPESPNWIGAGGPLWRVTMRGPDGEEKTVTSDDGGTPALIETRDGLTAMFSSPAPEALAATLRVRLEKGAALSKWSLEVAPAEGWNVVRAQVPCLAGLAYRDALKLATPTGWGLERDVAPGLSLDLPYPSCAAVMQFVAAYAGGHGLYVAAHDERAGYKHFQVAAEADGWSIGVDDHAPLDARENAYETPYEAVVGVFDGGACEAARIYRPFALGAPWSKAGPVSKRPIPQWLKDTDLWLKPGETPWTDDDAECRRVTMANVEWCRKAKAYFDVPISLHWYRWHQIPYDTLYPEYFPPKAGFVEGVQAAQEAGFRVMPYINGRLCDPESATWKEKGGAGWAVRDEKGEPHIEVYGSRVPLCPVCPTTDGWQSTVSNLVGRLVDEVGVDGVYIDQIAAAQPFECYASGHPDAKGGGAWWVAGYRELLGKARKRLPKDGVLTSEENAEPWNDLLDGLLIVNTPTSDSPLIPLYPAVYAGWVVPFGFQYIPKDEAIESLGFRSKMAHAFLWGSQPGWVDAARLMADGAERTREFVRNVVRCRRQAHDFLLTGRFLGEAEVAGDNPRLTAEAPGSFGGTYTLNLPAVMATAWQSEDGRAGVVLCNLDDAAHEVTVTLPAGTRAKSVRLVGPEGPAGEASVKDGKVSMTVEARGALVLR